MKKKKVNVVLLISAILGVAYTIYLIAYFTGAMGSAESGSDAAAGFIATALVTPHMICVGIAAIFNVLAAFLQKKGFALTCGILYSVGAVLFFMYALFVVPSIVLSFVGYAQLSKALKATPPTLET